MNKNKASLLIIVISILIPSVVAFLFYRSGSVQSHGIDLAFFPPFHAVLNSLTAILLIAGYCCIKMKKIAFHKAFMISAFILSSIFLISYVTYHSLAPSAKFGGEGFIRYIYFFILISHIILAAAIVPLVLFTLYRALTGQYDKHRKIAKWTFPLWFYVAISGVLVYVFMAPYY